MKLKQLNEEDAKSYAKYRNWLQNVAAYKLRLEDRNNKRLDLGSTIRKQREILKTLYKEESDLIKEIEELKTALIEVIPSRF